MERVKGETRITRVGSEKMRKRKMKVRVTTRRKNGEARKRKIEKTKKPREWKREKKEIN